MLTKNLRSRPQKSFSLQNKNIPEDNLNFALEHINQLRVKYSMPVYMKETGKQASYLERHLIKRFLEVLLSIFKYQIAPPFYRIINNSQRVTARKIIYDSSNHIF